MKLGKKATMKCEDGKTRTGRICYISPYDYYFVVQFKFFRESFFIERSHPPEHTNVRRKRLLQ